MPERDGPFDKGHQPVKGGAGDRSDRDLYRRAPRLALGEQADLWAGRLIEKHKDDLPSITREALNRISQRSVSDAEAKRGVALVRDLETKDKLDRRQAVKQFCLMALNLNEFLYLD